MKKKKKTNQIRIRKTRCARLFALALALALIAPIIVPMASARAVETFTINGVTISENSADYSARGNCSEFASQVLKKVFTFKNVTTTFNNQYNIVRGLSAEQRSITSDHTRQFIQSVPCGARIRICRSSNETDNNYDYSRQGHTIVLVARDDVNGTFTTLEGAYRGGSITRKYTYESFASEWPRDKGYKYFFYVDDFSSLFSQGKNGSSSSVQTNTNTNTNQKPEVSFEGIKVPQITCGKGQSIIGKISSKNATITKIRAYVPGTSLDKTVKVNNTTSYTLSGSALDNGIPFASLTRPGSYKLCFEITAAGRIFTSETDISVVAQYEKITMTGLGVQNGNVVRQGRGAHLLGNIASKGSAIKGVSCLIHQGSNVLLRKDVYFSNNTYQYSIFNSSIDYGISLGKIKAGNYSMSVLVLLRDGTSKITTTSFKVR